MAGLQRLSFDEAASGIWGWMADVTMVRLSFFSSEPLSSSNCFFWNQVETPIRTGLFLRLEAFVSSSAQRQLTEAFQQVLKALYVVVCCCLRQRRRRPLEGSMRLFRT